MKERQRLINTGKMQSEVNQKPRMKQASPILQMRQLNLRCLKTSGEARGQISNFENRNDLKGTYFDKVIMSPKLKFRSIQNLKNHQKTKEIAASKPATKIYERMDTQKQLLNPNNLNTKN